MDRKINIKGMSCNHCVNNVQNALSKISDVDNVEVSLKGNYAIVSSEEDISINKFKKAIESVGYEVKGIEKE